MSNKGLFLFPVKGYICVQYNKGLFLFPIGMNETPQSFLSNYPVLAWVKATQCYKHLYVY